MGGTEIDNLAQISWHLANFFALEIKIFILQIGNFFNKLKQKAGIYHNKIKLTRIMFFLI